MASHQQRHDAEALLERATWAAFEAWETFEAAVEADPTASRLWAAYVDAGNYTDQVASRRRLAWLASTSPALSAAWAAYEAASDEAARVYASLEQLTEAA